MHTPLSIFIYFGVGSSAPNIASMPGMPDFKSFFSAFFAAELSPLPPLLAWDYHFDEYDDLFEVMIKFGDDEYDEDDDGDEYSDNE